MKNPQIICSTLSLSYVNIFNSLETKFKLKKKKIPINKFESKTNLNFRYVIKLSKLNIKIASY